MVSKKEYDEKIKHWRESIENDIESGKINYITDEWIITDIRKPEIDKPCFSLGYCPYGSLVEYYPLGELEVEYAKKHNKYVKFTDDGWTKCDRDDPEAQPDLNWAAGKVENPYKCEIFGHNCPVHYQAELGEWFKEVNINDL